MNVPAPTSPQDNADEPIVARTEVLVDGDMSEQKLLTLIKLKKEEERLDYKTEYNPQKNPKDKVELVRDVIAMANTYGGYIVFGVREVTDGSAERYVPDGLPQEICDGMDVSKLREQVESYVSERTNIQFKLLTLIELDAKTFGLLYIPLSPENPLILNKDGQSKSLQGEKPDLVFRRGDIVVRKGASTDRVDQSDMRRIISDMRRREKAGWTEEIIGLRSLTQRLDVLIQLMLRGAKVPQGEGEQAGDLENYLEPSKGYDETWLYLSPDVFYGRISDLLESQRLPSVRRYIQNAPKIFFKHVAETISGGDNQLLEIRDNRMLPILDNLVAMGVAFIEFKQWELLSEIQKALYLICRQANKTKFSTPSDASVYWGEIWVWQEVMIRVYALGALLVYRNHWEQAQALIQQEVDWDSYYSSAYWSRYVLVMASRANQLEKQGWVNPAASYIQANEWLAGLFMSDKDEIANAVCQFDFLQCVYVAVNNNGNVRKSYPSFGVYYKHRTEPVIAKLVSPGKLRNTISSLTDAQLAKLIRDLDTLVTRSFPLHDSWDVGYWSDGKIKQFLESHPEVGQ